MGFVGRPGERGPTVTSREPTAIPLPRGAQRGAAHPSGNVVGEELADLLSDRVGHAGRWA